MENVATHEDWKVCFASLAPGLLLFARQWVRSRADAEDVVQEAFVRLWRRSHPIDTGAAGSRARETGQPELGGAPINRALLYPAVRSHRSHRSPADCRICATFAAKSAGSVCATGTVRATRKDAESASHISRR